MSKGVKYSSNSAVAPHRVRTDDLVVNSHTLYLLS